MASIRWADPLGWGTGSGAMKSTRMPGGPSRARREDLGGMYHVEEIVSSPERLERFARSLEGLEPPELRCAKIKLTSRCNLRCRMCRYGSTRGEDSLG